MNPRKTKTQWLWDDWGDVKGLQLRRRLLEKMGNSEEGQKRFWARVQRGQSNACWNWSGALDSYGYGVFSFQYEPQKRIGILTHRISYFLAHHHLPENLAICHHCDNRRCANPKHLFAGTDAQNVYDMMSKERHARGERIWKHKLTENQVSFIRFQHSQGEKAPSIAEMFEVSKQTIYSILERRTWKHIP